MSEAAPPDAGERAPTIQDTHPTGQPNPLFARAAGGFIGLGLGYAAQFAFNITVARILSVAEAGKVFQLIAVAALIGLVTRFGMERIAMREIGRCPDTGISQKVRTMLLKSLLIPGLSAVSVVVFVDLLDQVLWHKVFGSDLGLSDKFILAAAPFVSLCFVLSCVARGIRATFRAGMIQLAGIYGTTCLVLLGVLLVFRQPTKLELSVVFLLAAATCFVVSLTWLLRHRRLQVVPLGRDKEGGSWSGIGFFYAVTLLSFGLSGADVIAVSILMDDEATALYSVAAKVAFSLNIGLAGINSILFAMAARSHFTGNSAELRDTVTRTATWSAGFALCAAMVIGLGSTLVLNVFGNAYQGAESLLHILLLANVVNASMGGVSVVLQMTGHEKVAAILLAISLALMLLMYTILVPRYGLVGAGYATSVMLTITPVAMAMVIKSQLGFWPIPERALVVALWWVVLALLLWFKTHSDMPPLAWFAGGVACAISVFWHIAGTQGLRELAARLRVGG